MQVELPGLFDLQVNGFGGIDFNGPGLTGERVHEALEMLLETGVTRFLPTLITSPFDDFARNARVFAAVRHAAIAGIHMEGPYLSPQEGARGAHPREHLTVASADDFARRQEAAGGLIRLVTLAPEVSGALGLIEHLTASGVRVAIGHTAAMPDTVADAIAAGATLATHLGNGCAELLPRHPNVIWEALASDALFASLIVDGHHLPSSTVKAMVRAKGSARTILITDAGAAAGCAPGTYAIGGVTCVLAADGRVSLPGTPYLAGSSLRLNDAIANAVRFTGLPLAEAAAMASTTPAAYLGTTTRGRVTADWDEAAFTLRILQVRPEESSR
jgi:N-acetylglucosamine-6-phosphate deacetylase